MGLLTFRCWLGLAMAERIACVTCWTSAAGRVIEYIADCTKAAGTGTWIATLFVDASLTARAIRVDATFGTAVGRRPKVVGQARAGRCITLWSALGVRATRRGHTRINRLLLHNCSWWSRFRRNKRLGWNTNNTKWGKETLTGYGQAAVKGVASKASATRANWTVVEHTAECLLATRSRTGIYTLLGHTSLVRGTLRGDGALGATGWRRTNIFGQTRADRLLVEFPAL